MPFVHVRLIGTLSEQQKAEIAKQFTDTLEQVARNLSNILKLSLKRYLVRTGH